MANKLKNNIGFYIFKYFWYSVIFAGIFVSAYFNYKIIESIFLFVAYLVLRYAFPKTFHHNNFYKCIFWSIATFWVAIPNTMPITLSLFSSVLIGFVITFILYKVEDYVETKIALKEYTDKTIWVMDENELRQYCRLKGIKRDEHIQFVWLVLQGWTFGYISDKLGYSVDTLKDWSPVCKKKLGITDWNADKNDNTH